jgi:competence protein ComEA
MGKAKPESDISTLDFGRMVARAAMVLGAYLAIAAAPLPGQDLPNGPGKPVFEKVCVSCHGAAVVTRLKLTRAAWSAIIDDMVARGAGGTDEELAQVLDYLSANFGKTSSPNDKTNVNTADSHALATVLEITSAQADSIVSYRDKNGPFRDLDSLKRVPGLDSAKIEGKKDKLVF